MMNSLNENVSHSFRNHIINCYYGNVTINFEMNYVPEYGFFETKLVKVLPNNTVNIRSRIQIHTYQQLRSL